MSMKNQDQLVEYATAMADAIRLDAECRIRNMRITAASEALCSILLGNTAHRRIENCAEYVASIEAAAKGVGDLATARRDAVSRLFDLYAELPAELHDLFKHPSVLKSSVASDDIVRACDEAA